MNTNSTTRVIAFLVVVVVAGLILASFLGKKSDSSQQTGQVDSNEQVAGMFNSESYGFSVAYPDGFAMKDSSEITTGDASFPGVAFIAPLSLTAGTNLSEDTRFAVELMEGIETCSAALFAETPDVEVKTVTDPDGKSWSYAESSDAGAGNFYSEKLYAVGSGSRCYNLRFFVHSTNIANYEPGTVEEYDEAGLEDMFAAFRASFKIAQQ